MSHTAQALLLGLPVGLVNAHPIATYDDVLGDLLIRLGFQEGDEGRDAEIDEAATIYLAWVDTFADGRPYRMSDVGLERHLESWLTANLDRLASHGYPVRLGSGTPEDPGGAQWVFRQPRQRPDLICRFTEDTGWASTDDWLVIELKAAGAYLEAVDQVAGYVSTVRDQLARHDQRVHGLLVTDGASHEVQQHAAELAVRYLPLTALGYREVLIELSAKRPYCPSPSLRCRDDDH